jgi:hypothetical protein
MDIKYGDGLEFEGGGTEQQDSDYADAPNKVDALNQIIRDGFRAPVGSSQNISLTIASDRSRTAGQKTYPVFNLGASGVGIYLNALDELYSKQQLKGIIIDFDGKSFKVDGRVVHVSKDEAHVLCGIELTSINSECEKELLNHLRQCKKSLFS